MKIVFDSQANAMSSRGPRKYESAQIDDEELVVFLVKVKTALSTDTMQVSLDKEALKVQYEKGKERGFQDGKDSLSQEIRDLKKSLSERAEEIDRLERENQHLRGEMAREVRSKVSLVLHGLQEIVEKQTATRAVWSLKAFRKEMLEALDEVRRNYE